MLDITYIPGWDAKINAAQSAEQARYDVAGNNKNIDEMGTIPWNCLQFCGSETGNKHNSTLVAQRIVETILHYYDDAECLSGLFSAAKKEHARFSPFIATRSYRIKTTNCTLAGLIACNISPIYLLGPEYPEQYEKRHGAVLDDNAIIGLIDVPSTELANTNNRKFALGIDAGIAFNDSKIPHNHELQIELQPVDDGVMANLHCVGQTTSRKFTWNELGLILEKKTAHEPAKKVYR